MEYKICTCRVVWNSLCRKHGLSKDDPRQGYLQRDYKAAQERLNHA